MEWFFVSGVIVSVALHLHPCQAYQYHDGSLTSYCANYNDKPKNYEDFDFIIVGGGSAGSVLTNRLSEVPHLRVLLLEAGDAPIAAMDIPAVVALFQFSPYNWNYLTEKQENMSLGQKDQRMPWPRGKGLGGSSLINYMMYIRGNKIDYDLWEQMGNPGWSYEDVLPYFKKSEDIRAQNYEPDYHSKGGYLTVEDVLFKTPSAKAFVEGVQQLGFPEVDYNGRQQIGVSFLQSTLRDGFRCSAEKAFLRPARTRKNLKILKKAHVTKILIEPISKTAYGVEYVKDGKYYIARAEKEVIVSAGTLNSPQVLILSGIGPKEHLNELGIPIVQDLAVGEKLLDHLAFIGITFTTKEPVTFERSEFFDLRNYITLFAGKRTSALSSPGCVEAVSFLNLNLSNPNPLYPDVEFIFSGCGMQIDLGILYRQTFRIKDEIYNKVWKPIESNPVWQVYPLLSHPRSYGYLKLRSTNPFDPPKFYGNYLTDPNGEDIKTLIASIRIIQRIAETPMFKKYGTEIVTTPIPGCERFEFDSDPYWECAVRHVSSSIHHQTTTCKMGPKGDPQAVVDNRLRVYGIKNLRVADCSIIPVSLTAHTNVPAIMIGEKASDIIKQDWNLV